MDKLSLPIFAILDNALFVVGMTKGLKSYINRLICLSGLKVLVSVKMAKTNQIKEGRQDLLLFNFYLYFSFKFLKMKECEVRCK